jgi:ER-bound oxygenase mpaB/B'/Rubber oxygenase, catalytic domain
MAFYNALNLPSSLPRPGEQSVSLFGQTYGWNNDTHWSTDRLDALRLQGDYVLDAVLKALQAEGRPLEAGQDLLEMATRIQEDVNQGKTDLAQLSTADKTIYEWIEQYSRVPDWVDWEQIKRGQDVFLAYSVVFSVSLYYRSLVPGLSLPKIAQVLQRTAYLAPPSNRVPERLLDTGAFVAYCLTSPDALQPHQSGWAAAMRVRVLHAKVRHALMQGGKWDVSEYGIPINQEDTGGTLLAFAVNPLNGAEYILGGRSLCDQDKLDYLALWRYIGWIMGVSVEFDPCGPGKVNDPIHNSNAILSSVVLHLMHPDESSCKLAKHLLSMGSKTTGLFFYFRAYMLRRFIGDPLADALEMPMHPHWLVRLFLWLVSTVLLVFTTLYPICGLPGSPLRRVLIEFHRTKTRRFVSNWQSAHVKRISKQMKAKSVCPFAMAAAPQ